MKQELLVVKDLNTYLETVLQPVFKNSNLIIKGRKGKTSKLLPREAIGLFIVCVVGRFISKEDWTIASDPEDRDGIIYCKSDPRKGEGFATEQVYIPPFKQGDLTQLVLSAISKKSSRGKEYGKNRHLIIFCDKYGPLDHQKVKEEIATNDIFYSYWLIGKTHLINGITSWLHQRQLAIQLWLTK